MSYNLSEFNFQLPAVAHSRTKTATPFDLVATVSVKGRKRATTTYAFNMTGLQRRRNHWPKCVSFGVNKFKKKSVALLIEDNEKLDHVPIVQEDKGNPYPTANNKAFIIMLFNYGGVSIPEMPDTVVSVYFMCKEVQGQPHVYEVIADHVLLVDSNGGRERKVLRDFQQLQPSKNGF